MTEREGVLFDLWSHLPPEMQFRVVSFLDPFDLGRMCCVDRNSNDMASSDILWKECYLSHFSRPLGSPVREQGVTWKSLYGTHCETILVCQHTAFGAAGTSDVVNTLEAMGHKSVFGMPVNYKILDLEKQDRTHDPFSTEPTWLDTFADALARHPIVIFFTNGGMEESFGEKMGNLLAKHVDKGNAVIIGAFANGPKGECPTGVWKEEGYGPIHKSAYNIGKHARLGTKVNLKHPILRNVDHINCNFVSMSELHRYGSLIATFDNGAPLVAEQNFPGGGIVVSLNVFLPSDSTGEAGWHRTPEGTDEPRNDVDILLSNTCRYIIKHLYKMRIIMSHFEDT